MSDFYGCRKPDNINVSSTELGNLEFVEDLFMLKMPPPPSPRMGKIPALEENNIEIARQPMPNCNGHL
jgi:hypothetical protein